MKDVTESPVLNRSIEMDSNVTIIGYKYASKQSVNSLIQHRSHTNSIIRIQAWVRGCIFRLKRLPIFLYVIQDTLQKDRFNATTDHQDGRINSVFDEVAVINMLKRMFNTNTKIRIIPATKKRHWYDLQILDYRRGWLAVNVKSTTTKTADNVGNLSVCLCAYTDVEMDFNKSYRNDENVIEPLKTELKRELYYTNSKRDYYFLVINKSTENSVIVNSVRGLTEI